MHSLRTRITLMTVLVVLIALTIVTALSVYFIRSSERRESDQLLLLLCETGERNLDYYFDSVQNAVNRVSTYVESDLDGLEDEQLERHMERVEKFFEEMAYKTNGVLTYYYRIDPAVSDSVKGFWYTNLDGSVFVPHEPTDITQYDTQDTSRLVWFTVPKHTGEAIWLSPYITDNLDVRVISYNTPIYWHGQFVGVVGIEIDYSTMARQVESIRLYKNGYAFLNSTDGKLFFHPYIDVATLTDETMPETPEGLLASSTFLRYSYNGEEKQGAWLPLSNGMRLTVAVPVSETEGEWQKLVTQVLLVSLFVLLIMSAFTMLYTRRITAPLEDLTKAAELVVKDNYDFELEYDRDDEVGKLTRAFRQLTSHVKEHISDLNKRVYVDALTSVKNQGAFSDALDSLQEQIDRDETPEFAIGVFDCDGLKVINDQYGHDKGNLYLKNACQLICRVFHHSPVYRTGGDEFAVILKGNDFEKRDELIDRFEQNAKEACEKALNKWEEIHVAKGIAVYDRKTDPYVIDTVRRADKIMYQNKRARKGAEV
ncbi:MAG: diguanylate cyclase [Oscillospiraceae bacterium]|nr:diguanylate cyclase [Oscillospiraceae bacterium]